MTKPLRAAIGMAFLYGAPTGSVAAESSKVAAAKPQALSADEAKHLHYILDNTSRVVPHKLNLADPGQYAYVMDTLRRFKITPQSSPELFRRLAQARKGRAGPPILMEKADLSGASSNSNPPAVLGGVNYTTKFGRDSKQDFEASSYSSYPQDQIPYSTTVLVNLIDKDTNTSIGQNKQQAFSTTNVQSSLTATPPQNHGDIISNTMFVIAASKSSIPAVYNVVIEDQTGATAACQTSPNYSPTLGTSAQCQTSAATSCVNSGSVTKAIKVCYGNRVQSDCDYGCTGNSNPPNIIFPIVGSVNLGQAPVTPLTGTLFIVLNEASGGGCTLTATNNTTGALSSYVKVDASTNVASWNIAPATFPNQSCLQPQPMGSATAFNYTFMLYLNTTTGSAGQTFTSTGGSLPNTTPVPQVSLAVGCLPAGVRVRMADGSEKAIEAVVDDKDHDVAGSVRSPAIGARAVTATTHGTEDLPFVAIADSRGHRLLMTQQHPVPTARGPVVASALKVGDVVFTEAGEAKLTEVARQRHAPATPIYNIGVGSAQEAEAGETTFFANGILVGDQGMQSDLAAKAAKPRAMTQAETLRSLPVAWRQDYLNLLKGD